jgi:DNA-binding protein YbaB
MTGPMSAGAQRMGDYLRQAQQQAAPGGELRNRLAGLVGRAESPDGLIRVACTGEDPAHEVDIDPRVLRYVSEELAETLQTVFRAARADLARQIDEVLQEQAGDGGVMALVHDPAAAQRKLAQLTEMAEAATRDTDAVMDQMRRRFGR